MSPYPSFIAVEPAPQKPGAVNQLTSLVKGLDPKTAIVLLICAGLAIALNFAGDGLKSGSTKKNAKARAKWAGRKEILEARKLAIKQLNLRSRKSSSVWIVRPKTLAYPDAVCKSIKLKSGGTRKYAPEQGTIPKESPVVVKGDSATLWIPDTQRSIMVVGAPGSGKTFSAIDPMIRSVVEQGHPIILYDFKYPTQTSCIAWYAEQLGYKIHVFAPGFAESDVLNLFDFLTGDPEKDGSLARQLANTMNKNFKLGASSGGGGDFFDISGDQLVQGVMMLAKQMPHADLMMAQVILAAPQLIDRLFPESSGLNPWIRTAFDQIFSIKDSEKTVSSVVGTATLNFTRLMMPSILSACVGQTTLPLDLDGKTMVVFGLERELRDVMAPIVATAIHMIVNRNLFRKGGRKDPLYVVLDELPTIYLPQIVNWENESRSDGYNGICGFQNKSQLEKIYGKEMALAIMGGCATKFIFNPGEVESAEYFSKFFGDEEIVRRNTSTSGGGGKGGTSTSKSLEISTRKLVAPEEFIGLPPGTCIMTNPAYANKDMAYLPRRLSVQIPKEEIELAALIESNWIKTQGRMLGRVKHNIITKDDVLLRVQEFDERFPIPVEGEAEAPNPLSMLASML